MLTSQAHLPSSRNAVAFTCRIGLQTPRGTQSPFVFGIHFPQHVIESWLFERKNIVKTAEQMKRPLSEQEERRLAHLYSEKVERYLDSGYGSCYMKEERIAREVAKALLHFEGQRYTLAAWCVMPNHVHVVVQPFAGITGGTPVPHTELPEILHSWKSFTAKEANKLLGRSGYFWQAEYYDHLIRDETDFAHAVKYVLENPVKAGLKIWKWVGVVRASCA
jgi:REP element-mobilizing transposase RayT